MKHKIKIIYIFTIFFYLLITTSCEDMMGSYLDKAPGVDVTVDTIFSTQRDAETFLLSVYADGIHTDFPYWEERQGYIDAISACVTDEAENGATWYWSHNFNTGRQNPYWSGDDPRRPWRWRAIRSANILLERIDDVPDASSEYKNQAKGQARFIRALNYFEMIKRYGGMQIVRKSFEATDDLHIPRNTYAETVEFIVGDCDTATMQLPDKWPETFTGKATKACALMLKSRALLYAASPLSNSDNPYISMPNSEDNNIPYYGDYKKERWKSAADAAKEVIDYAPSAGIELIYDQGIDKNYRYVWEISDNKEVIFTPKMSGLGMGHAVWSMGFKSINNFYDNQAGTSITFNWVQKYEKKDGTPQTWNINGGDDLMQKYEDLDPRFKQSVAYNLNYWNEDFPVLKMFEGEGEVSPTHPPRYHNIGGQWMRKWIPGTLTLSRQAPINFYIFRLAEAYLNYAEATNEFYGPTQDAYDAVNIIRSRSGMPDFPKGLSQEEFREKLRNERSIELAFEDHRWWDVNRWMISEEEGIMRGEMWGIKIYRIGSTDQYRYEPYVFETRVFNRNNYLFPIMQNEINKGYTIQNPGW